MGRIKPLSRIGDWVPCLPVLINLLNDPFSDQRSGFLDRQILKLFIADEMAKKVRKLIETIRLNIMPPVLAGKSHNKSARLAIILII